MSSLENKAGSLDGWLERSSNRDMRRDLRKDDAFVLVPGPVLAPCAAGERCRTRRGGGRGTSLSIFWEVARSIQSRE
jgi:hypothetical protein